MILSINAVICFLIAARLFLFQRNCGNHRIIYAIIAWGLICSSASVAICIVFNKLGEAQIAQIIMNALTLACMLKNKGNIVEFVYRLFYQSKVTQPRRIKKAKTS